MVAIGPLLILAAGQIWVAFFGLAPTVLKMTGHERISFRILVAASITNIAFNLALIPLLGMLGAAISTAVTLVAAHAVLALAVSRSLGLRTVPLRGMG